MSLSFDLWASGSNRSPKLKFKFSFSHFLCWKFMKLPIDVVNRHRWWEFYWKFMEMIRRCENFFGVSLERRSPFISWKLQLNSYNRRLWTSPWVMRLLILQLQVKTNFQIAYASSGIKWSNKKVSSLTW